MVAHPSHVTYECHFKGDRQSVREQSAEHALQMALSAIEEE